LFSGLDATAKFLLATLPATEIAFLRYLGHVVLLLVLFRVWTRTNPFRAANYPMQILRGLTVLGSTAFNFAALRYLQLAETASIMFAGPLLVTLLAGPLLGEWPGIRRTVAAGVGFLGVLIIMRPGLGGMHWAALYSLAAMVSYAFYAILTRHMGRSESSEALLMWSGLVGVAGLAPLALPDFVMPEPVYWLFVPLMGAFGLFGHYALTVAFKLAPAPVLAPFSYAQMIWMLLLGYILFGDIPDVWTFVGAAVIIGSGLYVLHRERVRGKPPVLGTPPLR
jgi:drug/metabolite transporter (DMT)-like permease